MTTEPAGSEDWMPLNDCPAAKPAYDFSDTVTAGRTAVANGIRFYQTQDLSISKAQRAKNLAVMQMQPDITAFESQFTDASRSFRTGSSSAPPTPASTRK